MFLSQTDKSVSVCVGVREGKVQALRKENIFFPTTWNGN